MRMLRHSRRGSRSLSDIALRTIASTLPGSKRAAFDPWGRLPTVTAPIRLHHRFAALAVTVGIVVLFGAMLATFKGDLFHAGGDRFTTVVGGLESIPMSDGSHVTLNTDSEIRVSLGVRERVVEIEHGEAFFEVAHDPQRPFVVKAGGRRVIAVGTQFSVRWDGVELRVIVADGTVRYESHAGDTLPAASPAAGADAILLPAGSGARTEGNTLQVEQLPATEAERRLTWRSGFLTFRDTPLADAVAELNRYSTRKIVIEDPSIAALEVGGVVRSNDTAPFIRLLERGFGIRADVRADRIVLKAATGRAR
jgi:transmembrane sensor